MKTLTLTKTLLIALLGCTIPSLVVAETPPARTFQPGPWQPVARVDMSRPVEIQIVNNTDLILDYDLTSNINPSPKQLIPGESTTLKGFTIPVYLLVNRSVSASDPTLTNLLYEVNVDENNVVKLTVSRGTQGNPGYTTFNLNQTGAIFIY
jgi:hypothetical protein